MIYLIKTFFEKEHRFIMATPAVIWQVLFLWIPILLLIGMSFLKAGGPFGLTIFTFEYYRAIFNVAHWYIISRSLILASVTAIITLALAYPVAYFIALRVKRYKTTLLFLLTLPFWVNFLVHVYAWFFVLDRSGLLNTVLLKLGVITAPLSILNTASAIYVVMIHGYLPFMVMPVYAALEKFNTTLLDASFDLGASGAQTFWRITLPMTFAGIRSGFLFVYIASFGEYAVPNLLGGAKKLYAGQLIADYFLQARQPAVGAAFTVYSSAVLLVTALVLIWLLARAILPRGQS